MDDDADVPSPSGDNNADAGAEGPAILSGLPAVRLIGSIGRGTMGQMDDQGDGVEIAGEEGPEPRRSSSLYVEEALSSTASTSDPGSLRLGDGEERGGGLELAEFGPGADRGAGERQRPGGVRGRSERFNRAGRRSVVRWQSQDFEEKEEEEEGGWDDEGTPFHRSSIGDLSGARRGPQDAPLNGGASPGALANDSAFHSALCLPADDKAPNRPPRQGASRRRSDAWKFDSYELPKSTFTWLITEPCASPPFFAALSALALCLTSLIIVLCNELNNTSDLSPYGLPAGVRPEVIVAQYVGIMIGVLMEEEIPQGLEVLGACLEQHMLGRSPFSKTKTVISCLLRLIVGWLFLGCLFFAVLQESDALNIFFDVLALEFVENIDDIIFALAKRGFFGRKLRAAAYVSHKYEAPGVLRASLGTRTYMFSVWMKRCITMVYFFNAAVMLLGLSILTAEQHLGAFRCKSISVEFDDNVCEEAYVKREDGLGYEKRLLVFSHFNGIYEEEETAYGYPKYVERNKENGSPFKSTIGAEIVYCPNLEAWVFRHGMISTHEHGDEDHAHHECSWLLRSPETDSFDIIEVGMEGSWMVWVGRVQRDYSFTITCNECNDSADCNYHGKCINEKCKCDAEKHFGIHCEFDRPCDVIRSEKDPNKTLILSLDSDHLHDETDFVQVYGHPKYIRRNMSGIPHELMRLTDPNDDVFIDDDFFDIHMELEPFQQLLKNYTFVMKYTGRRWYGQIKPDEFVDNFMEAEFHAFWDRSFSGLGVDDNSTVIISAPTTRATPEGVDFFEMRRRNKVFEGGTHNFDYGPFGVLIPLIGAQGAGYFHCNADDNLSPSHNGHG